MFYSETNIHSSMLQKNSASFASVYAKSKQVRDSVYSLILKLENIGIAVTREILYSSSCSTGNLLLQN